MDKALALLRSRGGGDESVHDARKAFKKVRSVLRLVRDEIGEKTYHAENRRFRNAARPLTEVRDAKALVEILDKLAERSTHEAKTKFFAAARKSFQAERREIRRRVLKDQNVIPAVIAQVKAGGADCGIGPLRTRAGRVFPAASNRPTRMAAEPLSRPRRMQIPKPSTSGASKVSTSCTSFSCSSRCGPVSWRSSPRRSKRSPTFSATTMI
jgi:hypothetical protein